MSLSESFFVSFRQYCLLS